MRPSNNARPPIVIIVLVSSSRELMIEGFKMIRVKNIAVHVLPLTIVLLLATSDGTAASFQSSGSSKSSVAVLPYLNLSDTAEDEDLSESLWDETIVSLARVPGLQVASRSSSLKFKDSDEDIRLIGESLGVSYLVEGSVGRFDSLVRIMVQLIRVDDGTYVWTFTSDRDVASLESIPREIADSIAQAVRGL